MRFKRRLPVLIAVLLVAAALVAVVQLRRRAPPEPARLLPGADGFFYVNLKWLRTLKAIGQLPPVPHEPDYERFLQETGFQFERDLDEAAFAIHYPAKWRPGGTGGSAPEPRFSEVLVGKFQGERVIAYLHKMAGSVENFHSTDIYSIPLEGRTLRVAILGVDTVAASNHDDPSVIRGMVTRSRKLASPFAGPALLRQYYKSLPVVSKSLPVLKLAWFIGRVEPAAASSMGPWAMLFQKPASVVISAYYRANPRERASSSRSMVSGVPASAPEPSGHSSPRSMASGEARAVAAQHLDVREAPVSERDRLRLFRVRVAGHRRRRLVGRALRQRRRCSVATRSSASLQARSSARV